MFVIFSILDLVQQKINVRGTSPRNQFRDYFIWNRIEKLMPQLWNFPPQTLKTLRQITNLFSNLDFLQKSGFPKTRDLSPGVIHDFWKIDVLDACLMVHGSWLKAHGSWPREARGGSWLMAHGQGPARLRGPRGRPQVRARALSLPWP